MLTLVLGVVGGLMAPAVFILISLMAFGSAVSAFED